MNITIEYKSFSKLVKNSYVNVGEKDSIWIIVEQGVGRIEYMSLDGIYEYTAPFTPITVSEEGQINLPFKQFYKYIKSIVRDFSIVSKRDKCFLKYSGGSISFPIGKGIYTEIIKPGDFFYIDNFKKSILSVKDFIGCEGDVLENICIRRKDETLEISGLNGAYFALNKNSCPQEFKENRLLIRESVIKPILRFIDEKTVVSVTDKRVFFKNANDEIFSIPRTIDNTYPDYDVFLKHFEKESKLYKVTIDRNIIVKSLERMGYAEIESAKFFFDDKKLNIVNSSKNCAIEDSIQIIHSQGPILKNILFTAENLMKVFTHCSDKNIVLTFTTENGPCRIQGEEDERYMAIVMPLIDSSDKDFMF